MARLASRSSLLYFLYFIYLLYFLLFPHSFAVFCTPRKLTSFLFNRFRTLCQKHPGWGTSCPSTRIKMKPQTANPVVQSARCSHRDPKGRQCRALALDRRSGLCPRHLAEQQQGLAADHFRHLTTRCQFFQTAQGINYSLLNLYQLLAQKRISPRRAAVLSYISSLLLRTLPQIEAEGPAGIIGPTNPVPTNVTLPDENVDSDDEDKEEDDSDLDPELDDDANTDSETEIEAETETAAETDTQLDSANTWDPSIPAPDPKKKPS